MFSPTPTLVASFLLVISSVYAAGEFENYEILDSTTDNATVIRDILAKNGTGAVGGVSFLNGRANIFLEVAEIVNKTTGNATTELLFNMNNLVDTSGVDGNITAATICVIVSDLTDAAISAGQNDDGTCLATLGKECQTDLINSATYPSPLTSNSSTICEQISVAIPSSCSSKFLGGSISFRMRPFIDAVPFLRITASSDNVGSGGLAPHGHDVSNLTLYKAARHTVTPLRFITFEAGVNSSVLGSASSSSLACLRANTTTYGSQNAVGRVGVWSGYLLIVLGVGTTMLGSSF